MRFILKEFVRTIKDYPIKGIQFRDITTLLQRADLFHDLIDEMTKPWENKNIDAIVSIEARGFIMAGAIAYKLNTAFIPMRKPDKLPADTFKVKFDLEYGSTEMHLHKDALDNHQNILIVDDLLATGGTAVAASELIQMLGANVAGYAFLISLKKLNGDKKLSKFSDNIISLVNY